MHCAYEFDVLYKDILYRNDEDPALANETHILLLGEADCQTPFDGQDVNLTDCEFRERTRYFASSRFSPCKYWPMYKVPLLEDSKQSVTRPSDGLPDFKGIGTGKIHLDALDEVAKKAKISPCVVRSRPRSSETWQTMLYENLAQSLPVRRQDCGRLCC